LGVVLEDLGSSTKIVAESPEIAEILALDLLVNLAIENQVKDLNAIGDCKAVIRLMNRRKTKSRLKVYHEQIKSLEEQFDNIIYSWIPRQHNRKANKLAKEVLNE
jgi:ribonuclease HI